MATLPELRIERQLSQDELAELAGISRTVIWRAETGRRIYKRSYDTLCRALGVGRIDGLNVYRGIGIKKKRRTV